MTAWRAVCLFVAMQMLACDASAPPALNARDLTVFQFFYDSMGGANWTSCSASRNSPCTLCPGVRCALGPDGSSTFLSTISLPNANLRGWLPDIALDVLSMLAVLNLQNATFLNTGCLSLPLCYTTWSCTLNTTKLCAPPLQSTLAPQQSTTKPTTAAPTTRSPTAVIIQDSTHAPTTSRPTSSAPSRSPTSASPTLPQPSTAPTVSPSPAYVHCLPPVYSGAYDVDAQFPFAENTPSDCLPWSFGWTPVKGGAFSLLDSMLVSNTMVPSCSARVFPYIQPWGIESFVWKAFEDNCTMLPLRRVGEYDPLGKVMLHNGRLSVVRMRFVTPATGLYKVQVQFFPGDVKSVRGTLAVDADTMVTFPTTDLLPAVVRTMVLVEGQTLNAWASGVDVNVPVDMAIVFAQELNASASCPLVNANANLRAHLALLGVGGPSVCAPFTFGWMPVAGGVLQPMPYGLYGGGAASPCTNFFASPHGPLPALITVELCNYGAQVAFTVGRVDTPVVRFIAQVDGDYQVVLNADSGCAAGLVVNKVPASDVNFLATLSSGDTIDLVVSATCVVHDFVVIYVGGAVATAKKRSG